MILYPFVLIFSSAIIIGGNFKLEGFYHFNETIEWMGAGRNES